MEKYKKLDIIEVNKSVIMASPLQGDYTLCRTGTIGEGSCFLHSILHSYSSKYVSLSVIRRMKYISKLRRSLSFLTIDKWETLGNGLVSKISFQETLISLLNKFYCSVGKNKVFDNIINIINIEIFEQKILPLIYSKYEKDSIDLQKQKILKYSILYFEKQLQYKKINDENMVVMFKKILKNILYLAKKNAYDTYIKNLYSSSTHIDQYFIEIISDYFNRDIYFIDGKTRMLYQNASKDNIKNRKSIILIWVDNCHYEIMGRLLSNNKIEREFENDDPLIYKLKMFLCNPEQIKQYYPELVEYLPNVYKNNMKIKSPPRNLELDNSDIDE